LDILMRQRRGFGLGLVLAASALALGSISIGIVPDTEARLGFNVDWDTWPQWIGGTLMAMVCLVAGLWLWLAAPERVTLASTRILALGGGGLFGLILALATAAQAWLWRNEVLFGGMEAWQGAGGWRLWACAAAGLVGLGIMLVSLFLAKSEER